jgi:AAA15 family ATPase/GTPase
MAMLCQFSFKNFKSYRDLTVLEMQAENITEHSESLLNTPKCLKHFLPVSVLYGANGSGKSGVLEALNALVSRVVNPVDEIYYIASLSMRYIGCPPFLFNETSPNEPTEFELYFRVSNNEFRYTLALMGDRVISESLYRKIIGAKRPALIFERDTDDIKLGVILGRKVSKNVNDKMPYLSFLAIHYNYQVIEEVIGWLIKIIFINYMNASHALKVLLTQKYKKQIIDIMQEIDIPISDYEVVYNKDNKKEEETIDDVFFIRHLKGEVYKLSLDQESGGTYKLFGLLPRVMHSLTEGALLVVDEMDANLHPKLLRHIIKLYKDKSVNKNNAQLLFTSQDIATMKSDLFRRDEILFAAKGKDGASEIYSLYDIRNTDGVGFLSFVHQTHGGEFRTVR